MELCKIEQIEISDEEMEHNAAAQILAHEGTALVAVGSLACVRSLWFQAYRRKKLGQFWGCALPAWNYASGKNDRVIRNIIEAAAQNRGTKEIIVYASCMEYLTQWALEPDGEKIYTENQIPIKVLFRGPLTKRCGNPLKQLENTEIFPDAGQSKQKINSLPPVAPDFSGIMAFLSEIDCNAVIISPGGCKSCIEYVDGQKRSIQINGQYGTRFTDISVISGCEPVLTDTLCKKFVDKKLLFLTGSAVAQMIGLDYEYLGEELAERGKKAVYLKSDGFSGCPQAVNDAMLKVGKIYFQNSRDQQRNLVLITGYTTLAVGKKELLLPVIERLWKKGMTVQYLGENFERRDHPLPGVIWMVSAEGISVTQWLQEEYDIPFVTGRNLGDIGADELADTIALHADNEKRKLTPFKKVSFPDNDVQGERNNKKEDIWIIGEPVLSISLYRFCSLHYQDKNIKTAVYVPAQGMHHVYKILS
ncbi:MAG: nitrogenase component 1, partial [Oliverpabstia sp.]